MSSVSPGLSLIGSVKIRGVPGTSATSGGISVACRHTASFLGEWYPPLVRPPGRYPGFFTTEITEDTEDFVQ